jgi:hypothetical protein
MQVPESGEPPTRARRPTRDLPQPSQGQAPTQATVPLGACPPTRNDARVPRSQGSCVFAYTHSLISNDKPGPGVTPPTSRCPATHVHAALPDVGSLPCGAPVSGAPDSLHIAGGIPSPATGQPEQRGWTVTQQLLDTKRAVGGGGSRAPPKLCSWERPRVRALSPQRVGCKVGPPGDREPHLGPAHRGRLRTWCAVAWASLSFRALS